MARQREAPVFRFPILDFGGLLEGVSRDLAVSVSFPDRGAPEALHREASGYRHRLQAVR